ncbi:hypothetical protein V8E53_000565, partial [Lactarius tabidus]
MWASRLLIILCQLSTMFSSTVALPVVRTLKPSVHHSLSPRSVGQIVHIRRRKKQKALDAVNILQNMKHARIMRRTLSPSSGTVARRKEYSDRDV